MTQLVIIPAKKVSPPLIAIPQDSYAMRGPGDTRIMEHDGKEFHWCGHCGGWVPDGLSVISDRHLIHRQKAGRHYLCGKCGKEIAFVRLRS